MSPAEVVVHNAVPPTVGRIVHVYADDATKTYGPFPATVTAVEKEMGANGLVHVSIFPPAARHLHPFPLGASILQIPLPLKEGDAVIKQIDGKPFGLSWQWPPRS